MCNYSTPSPVKPVCYKATCYLGELLASHSLAKPQKLLICFTYVMSDVTEIQKLAEFLSIFLYLSKDVITK